METLPPSWLNWTQQGLQDRAAFLVHQPQEGKLKQEGRGGGSLLPPLLLTPHPSLSHTENLDQAHPSMCSFLTTFTIQRGVYAS